MKISAFYVTKNQNVIDEKMVLKNSTQIIKGVAFAKIGIEVLPLIENTQIIAHASTVTNASENVNVSQALSPLINTLQDLAEPFSYGFCVKGVLQKMAGKENEGNKTIKNALGGYLVVQFLPEIYKLLELVKL